MSNANLFMMLGIILLILIVCALVIYIYMIKRQMKQLQNDLQKTRAMDYNQQMTISLVDEDLSNLTTEINKNLDFQKELKLQTEQKEQQIKQSISDIAHDLRTPLTVVKGNLQMLEKDDAMSSRSKEYVDICLDKTDALKSMVDEFFELSVLESESILPNLTRVNITNYLAQFVIDNEAVIMEQKIIPEFDLPDQSLFVMADEVMLGRIFSNLLNNIFQYAKDSFRVEVMQEGDNQVLIIFSNEVEEGRDFDVNQLFERTYRADKARQGKGAGLGLYIVRLLAQKQKIDVWAKRVDNRLSFILKIEKSN